MNCSAPKISGRQVLVMNDGSKKVDTKNGLVCSCTLGNSLVYTPHNGHLYSITGTFDDLNENSLLSLGNGEVTTSKQYYKLRFVLSIQYQPLLDLNDVL